MATDNPTPTPAPTPEITPELIEKLLPAIADQVSNDIRKFLSEQLTPVVEELAEFKQQYEADKATPQDSEGTDEGTDEPSPVELRVRQLEKILADKEAAEKEFKFDAALRDAVEANGAQFPKEAATFLKATLTGQLTETKTGSYLAKDGRDLNTIAKEFFASDFGKHLLPSQAVDGAGVSGAEGKSKQGSSRDAEIIAALI